MENYGGDWIISVNSHISEQSDIAGQSFLGGWVIGFHSTVIVLYCIAFFGAQLSTVYWFFYFSLPHVFVYLQHSEARQLLT